MSIAITDIFVRQDNAKAQLDNSRARDRRVAFQEFLDRLQIPETELARREDVVREIDHLRERLFASYGQMLDSVNILREDRAR